MQTKRSGRAGRRIKHAKYGKKSALFRAAALLGAFCFPLETTQWRISDGYGWREDPFTGKRAFHKGIDLACAEGTGILAVQGGTVLRTKRSASYGSCIELLLADGTAAVYPHLHFELYRQGKVCDPADALDLSHEAS